MRIEKCSEPLAIAVYGAQVLVTLLCASFLAFAELGRDSFGQSILVFIVILTNVAVEIACGARKTHPSQTSQKSISGIITALNWGRLISIFLLGIAFIFAIKMSP